MHWQEHGGDITNSFLGLCLTETADSGMPLLMFASAAGPGDRAGPAAGIPACTRAASGAFRGQHQGA